MTTQEQRQEQRLEQRPEPRLESGLETRFEQLADIVAGLDEVAIAVSGGVDSLTLATFIGRQRGAGAVLAVHAVSPAVPAEATSRVRWFARQEGWALEVVDAGEFDDARYRANPVNRCFFCKSRLYSAIAARSHRRILSGTNSDDLGEYRPGLDAARASGVRHPYVEAGMGKLAVRALARHLYLGDVAEMPATPCLSSRIETGIPIDGRSLAFVHAVENMIRASDLQPQIVRCRVRRDGVTIELDRPTLERLAPDTAEAWRRQVMGRIGSSGAPAAVRFAAYRSGSAFVGAPAGGGSGATKAQPAGESTVPPAAVALGAAAAVPPSAVAGPQAELAR
jgi:uncharacterized protein